MRDFPDFLALITLLAVLAVATVTCLPPNPPAAEARLLVVAEDHPGPVGDWQPALARHIVPKLRSVLPPPQGTFHLAPPACVELLCDPCPTGEGEERVRCWVEHALRVWDGPEEETELAVRVAWRESGYDPAAKNPKSSATGLFQFINSTWRWVADELELDDRTDGWQHTLAAVWLAGKSKWRTHWQVCANFGDGVGSVRCGSAGGWLRR